MESESVSACRICKSYTGGDLIKSPCLCKGSLGYVHFTCLERWLNLVGKDCCEICQQQFVAVRSRRYSLAQSLRIWVGNPAHRTYLCIDLLIALVLTALTAAIVFICLAEAGLFLRQEERVKEPFLQVVMVLFLFILLSSYVTSLYLIVQDHVKPWYHWWSNCVNVRLLPVHPLPAHKIQDDSAVESREIVNLHASPSVIAVKKEDEADETTLLAHRDVNSATRLNTESHEKVLFDYICVHDEGSVKTEEKLKDSTLITNASASNTTVPISPKRVELGLDESRHFIDGKDIKTTKENVSTVGLFPSKNNNDTETLNSKACEESEDSSCVHNINESKKTIDLMKDDILEFRTLPAKYDTSTTPFNSNILKDSLNVDDSKKNLK